MIKTYYKMMVEATADKMIRESIAANSQMQADAGYSANANADAGMIAADDYEDHQAVLAADAAERKYGPNTVGAVVELLKRCDPTDKLKFKSAEDGTEWFLTDISRQVRTSSGTTVL